MGVCNRGWGVYDSEEVCCAPGVSFAQVRAAVARRLIYNTIFTSHNLDLVSLNINVCGFVHVVP